MLDDMDEVDAQRALAVVLPAVVEADGRGQDTFIADFNIADLSSAARTRLVQLLREHGFRTVPENGGWRVVRQ
jgi:hypothetical protein